ATVVSNLSTKVDTPTIQPTSERQVRPLASLQPDDQRTVWEQAVEESGGEQPTALKVSEVKKVVTERRAEPEREVERPPMSNPRNIDNPLRLAITQLNRAIDAVSANDPYRNRIRA